MRNGFKFLKHAESKTRQFEIVLGLIHMEVGDPGEVRYLTCPW